MSLLLVTKPGPQIAAHALHSVHSVGLSGQEHKPPLQSSLASMGHGSVLQESSCLMDLSKHRPSVLATIIRLLVTTPPPHVTAHSLHSVHGVEASEHTHKPPPQSCISCMVSMLHESVTILRLLIVSHDPLHSLHPVHSVPASEHSSTLKLDTKLYKELFTLA